MGNQISARQTSSVDGTREQPLRMLMVGCTGSGKTSFLNLLGNLDIVMEHGMKPEAFHKIKNINSTNLEQNLLCKQKMQSGTDEASVYVFKLGGCEFEVVDTPGFGDTRGTDTDQKHIRSIQGVVHKAQMIDAVCLVINGRIARQFATEAYVLSEVSALLPKKCLKNVIVVFTNCAGALQLNYDIKVIEDEIQDSLKGRYFCVDNPFCLIDGVKNLSETLQEEAIDETMEAFGKTVKSLKKMFECVRAMETIPTKHFDEVRNARLAVEQLVTETMAQVDQLESKGRELEIMKKELPAKVQAMRQASKEIAGKSKEVEEKEATELKHTQEQRKVAGELETHRKKSKELSSQTETQWSLEASSDVNAVHTICNFKGCHCNCHESCTLDKIDEAAENGQERFRSCTAFNTKKKTLKLSTEADRTKLKALCKETTCGYSNERGVATKDQQKGMMRVCEPCSFNGTHMGKDGWFSLGRIWTPSMAEVNAAKLPVEIDIIDRTEQHICNKCKHHAKDHVHIYKKWVSKQVPKISLDSVLKKEYEKMLEREQEAIKQKAQVGGYVSTDHAEVESKRQELSALQEKERHATRQKEIQEKAAQSLEHEVNNLKMKKQTVQTNLISKLDEFSRIAVAKSYVNILEKQRNVVQERFDAEPSSRMLKDTLKTLDQKIAVMKK